MKKEIKLMLDVIAAWAKGVEENPLLVMYSLPEAIVRAKEFSYSPVSVADKAIDKVLRVYDIRDLDKVSNLIFCHMNLWNAGKTELQELIKQYKKENDENIC